MKKLIKFILGIFVVLAILFVALELSLNKIFLKVINSAAPTALGVPTTLQGADISLLRGNATLQGLHIGNPKGYKTPGLLDLASITVCVDNSSLLSDTILIQSIAIDGLVVTYEKGLLNSNLGALIELLSAAEDPAVSKPEDKKSTKKVIIEKLTITGGRMHFSVTGAMGAAIPVPLPPITLTDLGKEKEGVTIVEAIQYILKAIAGATGTAIVGSAQLLGKGALTVGEVGIEAGKAIVGGTVDAGKAVVGGAVDAGKAIGGGAVDAGKAIASGVGDALNAVNPFKK